MNHQINFFKVIKKPHTSEKASKIMEKNNTFIIRVAKEITKLQIKHAIQNLFTVEVKTINTLIVKGKKKLYKKNIGYSNSWKKAFVTLKKGQNLDLFKKVSE